MLIADRKGTRTASLLSKRRSTRTDLRATSSTRHAGISIPALAANVRARASHSTALISPPLFGNFARFKGEALAVSEPVSVVFEAGALPAFAKASPQAPHQLGRSAEIHVNQQLFFHYAIPVLPGL